MKHFVNCLMAVAAFLNVTSVAQAQGLFDILNCTTNVTGDISQPWTSITVSESRAGLIYVTVQSHGGRAQFITQPRTFEVSVQSYDGTHGQYLNSKENFDLNLTLEPATGKLDGMLVGKSPKFQTPVVCIKAFN